MCLSIAITAARLGATIANHVRVTSLIKDDNGRVIGAGILFMLLLENYQALLWSIFQVGKFLWEMATLSFIVKGARTYDSIHHSKLNNFGDNEEVNN